MYPRGFPNPGTCEGSEATGLNLLRRKLRLQNNGINKSEISLMKLMNNSQFTQLKKGNVI